MNATVRVKENVLKVYIEFVLHLRVLYSDIKGVQSWQDSNGFYYIEFYVEGSNQLVELEYDDKEKWKQILKLLDEVL